MNTGISKTLKTYGTIIGVIGVIANVVTGIVLISIACKNFSYMQGLFWTGLAILIVGTFISLLIPLLINGFAELIRSTQSIEKKLCGEEMNVEQNSTNTTTTSESVYTSKEKTSQKSEFAWDCPNCGKTNHKSDAVCVWCKQGHRD